MASVMGGTPPAAEAKPQEKKDETAPKPAPPAHLRDEQILKFAGTATLLVGIVLLVASALAMGILSVMRFELAPWVPFLPLALIIVLVGGLVNVYYRKVIDREINPKKYEQAARVSYPYGYPSYPMAAPMPYPGPAGYYPPRPYGVASVPAPIPQPAPAPSSATPAPGAGMRFCIMCGKRIPVEAKFCPYCRHAYRA